MNQIQASYDPRTLEHVIGFLIFYPCNCEVLILLLFMLSHQKLNGRWYLCHYVWSLTFIRQNFIIIQIVTNIV